MEQFQIKKKSLIIRMPQELDHHSAEVIRQESDRLDRKSTRLNSSHTS